MAILDVQAHGDNHSNDHRLFLNVSVKDAAGQPVGGLTTKEFEAWGLGAFFGDLDWNVFQDLGEDFPGLAGVYRLVIHHWAPAVDGTFTFWVKVTHGADEGGAMASVVKMGGLP